VIRPAGGRDTEAIADIYNEGIATRLATFETEPRTAADVELWLAAGDRLPTLVAEEDDVVLGWARVLAYSDRPVYAGVGEVSVYVAEHARGRGLGRRLLDRPAAASEGARVLEAGRQAVHRERRQRGDGAPLRLARGGDAPQALPPGR
jgi:L-amino acid N-acyltransferase YncA